MSTTSLTAATILAENARRARRSAKGQEESAGSAAEGTSTIASVTTAGAAKKDAALDDSSRTPVSLNIADETDFLSDEETAGRGEGEHNVEVDPPDRHNTLSSQQSRRQSESSYRPSMIDDSPAATFSKSRRANIHRQSSIGFYDDTRRLSREDHEQSAYWMPPPRTTEHETSSPTEVHFESGKRKPLQVDFRCACFKLCNISTVDFTALIKFVVVFEWNDPRLCGVPITTNDLPNDLWGPDIVLENAQSEVEIIYDSFSLLDASTGRLKRTVTFHGPVYNPMSLRDFPFDNDDFEMKFISICNWRTLDGSRFGNDPTERVYILNPMINLKGVEFFFFGWGRKVNEFTILGWSQDVQNSLDDPSRPIVFKFDIHLARKATFYYLKVLFPLWLIVLTSLAPYAIETDDLQGRLEVLVTLLLSAIAFLYIVQESLPKISHLTIIDRVVIASLVSLVLAVLFSVLISMSPNPETHNWVLALVNQALYWMVNLALVGPPHYRHKKHIADMEARQASKALTRSGHIMPGMITGKLTKSGRRIVKLANNRSFSMTRNVTQGDHEQLHRSMLGFTRFSVHRNPNIDVAKEQTESSDEIVELPKANRSYV